MQLTDSLAPGSRVRVRGEEWAVERCLPLPTAGYAVHVQGLSELVRGHQAIFLRREVVASRGPAQRLRARLGAHRDRRARRPGARPNHRRVLHHLPHAVPGPPRLREQHLVRLPGPHRLHHQQRPHRRRPRPRKAFKLWQNCLQNGTSLPKDFDTQGLVPFTEPGRAPVDVRDREANMRWAYAFMTQTPFNTTSSETINQK